VKVLFLTSDFPPTIGGVATYYARVCAAAPPGEVTVLAPDMEGAGPLDAAAPYRVVRRSIPSSPRPLPRLAQIALMLWHGFWLARRERADCLHIGHLHLAPVGWLLSRIARRPYVLYLHGGELAGYLRIGIVRAICRASIRAARFVVVNSQFSRDYYAGLGMAHPRVRVLTLSVDPARFRPSIDTAGVRAKYGLNGGPTALTVGRLVERKGHDMVIRALAALREAHPSLRYAIAGRGPEEPALRALAASLSVADRVAFLGYVPDDELPALYRACDLFTMPSRALAQRDGIEGFGIVFLEANACGRPVVGGRSGGMADAVVDGVTGFLVDPLDPAAIAGAIAALLADPARAEAMGAAGRRRVEELERAWPARVREIWTDSRP
jgi:phosphatidylinositol alpha-1,6-mannosyltransferase